MERSFGGSDEILSLNNSDQPKKRTIRRSLSMNDINNIIIAQDDEDENDDINRYSLNENTAYNAPVASSNNNNLNETFELEKPSIILIEKSLMNININDTKCNNNKNVLEIEDLENKITPAKILNDDLNCSASDPQIITMSDETFKIKYNGQNEELQTSIKLMETLQSTSANLNLFMPDFSNNVKIKVSAFDFLKIQNLLETIENCVQTFKENLELV
jgi:hypothetical protein